jgi:hypothetical protein
MPLDPPTLLLLIDRSRDWRDVASPDRGVEQAVRRP